MNTLLPQLHFVRPDMGEFFITTCEGARRTFLILARPSMEPLLVSWDPAVEDEAMCWEHRSGYPALGMAFELSACYPDGRVVTHYRRPSDLPPLSTWRHAKEASPCIASYFMDDEGRLGFGYRTETGGYCLLSAPRCFEPIAHCPAR